MAFTKNGIYYNDDYNSVADVLLDSQKMAESIDEQMKIQIKETEKAMKKNSEQDNSISEMQEELKNLRNISNMLPTISKKGEKIENYDEKEITDEFKCDYLISACWMMRYETYKKIGKLDEKIFYSPEDVEYCMRIREKGLEIVHLRKAEIIHYYQRISKKKLISKANITHFTGIHYILKKYRKFLRKYRKERN